MIKVIQEDQINLIAKSTKEASVLEKARESLLKKYNIRGYGFFELSTTGSTIHMRPTKSSKIENITISNTEGLRIKEKGTKDVGISESARDYAAIDLENHIYRIYYDPED